MKHAKQLIIGAILVLTSLSDAFSARADITCYDFDIPTEIDTVFSALPNDPYGLDSGWPELSESSAQNGVPCDQRHDTPEQATPGDELKDKRVGGGLKDRPDGLVEAVVAEPGIWPISV